MRGGTIANVYPGELHEGNVAWGRVAYVGEHLAGPDTRIVDATGVIVAPGGA